MNQYTRIDIKNRNYREKVKKGKRDSQTNRKIVREKQVDKNRKKVNEKDRELEKNIQKE